jgi:hypothetical protein
MASKAPISAEMDGKSGLMPKTGDAPKALSIERESEMNSP